MTEKVDPLIEVALIQAAATIAVEASAYRERNLRARARVSGPLDLPVIDGEDGTYTVTIVADHFGAALDAVKEQYAEHLIRLQQKQR
ncbi:hypothetical protein [Gluconobacter sp. Gdi]|uniref:hypothetical protein n=1 Tax=Gluconobacter sp. Gdi TaxID=2691888 RepID=UPI001768111C|nr:hypothetical protein [Gluconobacter sp. Gdi]GFE98107.1 hypothetical protein DmGdi_31800 [Gluconobacter sp. Gdi]